MESLGPCQALLHFSAYSCCTLIEVRLIIRSSALDSLQLLSAQTLSIISHSSLTAYYREIIYLQLLAEFACQERTWFGAPWDVTDVEIISSHPNSGHSILFHNIPCLNVLKQWVILGDQVQQSSEGPKIFRNCC